MSPGGQRNPRAGEFIRLTPPPIIDALGGPLSFDLDPCAAPEPRPWPTARRMNARADADGLMIRWDGRIWLNPPYSRGQIERWLARMAAHGQGTALIFASTDTEAFGRYVWESASGLFFLKGRLSFFDRNGQLTKRPSGRNDNAPLPSVLCAYGQEDLDRLAACDLEGALVPLRFARFAIIAGMDQSWREAMHWWLMRQRGPISIADAYRYFAHHPKAKRNPNWMAKVRQQLQLVGRRVGRGRYESRAALL